MTSIPTDEPNTFQNHVTHWWDGSQLYGSDEETSRRLRSFKNGKLRMGRDNLLPVDKKTGIDITGETLVFIASQFARLIPRPCQAKGAGKRSGTRSGKNFQTVVHLRHHTN